MKPLIPEENVKSGKNGPFNYHNLIYLLIPAIAVIIYYSSFRHGLIQDDFYYIYEASHHFSFYDLFVNSFFSLNFYRPITNGFYYYISYSLFSLNPLGYHAIIFIFFIVDVLLVFLFMNELLGRVEIAIMGTIFYMTRGLFFVPLFWVASGFNELGTTLVILCSAYLFLRYMKYGNTAWYAGSILFFILALMSKESAIILPLLILLTCLYYRKNNKGWIKHIILVLFPYLAIVIVYMARWYVISTMISSTYYTMVISPQVALQNIIFYLSNIANNQIELFIVGLFMALAVTDRRDLKTILYMAAWSCVCMLPYLFLESMHYAYYLSVSLLGIAVVFGLGFKKFTDWLPHMRSALMPMAVILLVLSGCFSINAQETLSAITIQETTVNNIMKYLRSEFPGFPDNSLLYVKNSDFRTFAALGYGDSAIKLYYNDSVNVYFENVSTVVPEHNVTFYFTNVNDTLYYINQSD